MFPRKLGWIAYLVSNFDIIVVTVDGRGTGYRGERLVSKDQEYQFLRPLQGSVQTSNFTWSYMCCI